MSQFDVGTGNRDRSRLLDLAIAGAEEARVHEATERSVAGEKDRVAIIDISPIWTNRTVLAITNSPI